MTNQKGQSSPRRSGSNGNYDRSFIMEVVAEVESGKPIVWVRNKYNLSKGTLVYWLKHYSSSGYRQNRKKPYSDQIRRSILHAINKGSMTMAEVQSAYNIRGNATIKRWIALEKQENDDLSCCNPLMMKENKSTDAKEIQPLAEVADLQQQLADARLKIAALNTLIDVAEEQLKINIRKKPGAKQS